MIKNHLWLVLFFVFSCYVSSRGQDMASMEADPIPQHLIETVSQQREVIISALDSPGVLSYSDSLYTAEDSLLYNRMRRIQKTIPLALNDKIKTYIDKYISQNYNPYMSKLQGLTQYYFPIYEKIFSEQNMPDEIKYLSVIESSLDPHVVSRSGAVGLWQFMYPTAKFYDLTMDRYVDERKDPYAACYAASRYLQEAYEEFGDWLLALASYNCGRGGVRRAIQRSGLETPDFWRLSPFLPKETQDYIPKFIAMRYVLGYADVYGISAAPTDFTMDVLPIMVERTVNLRDIAAATNLSLEVVKKFNPAYKSTLVHGSMESPRRLILPDTKKMNDSLLYSALNNQQEGRQENASDDVKLVTAELVEKGVKGAKKGKLASLPAKSSRRITKKSATTYTVKKGDTLSHIAARFRGVSVSQLKADNRLRSNRLRVGQKLTIKDR